MRGGAIGMLVCALAAVSVSAQTVSEWKSSNGLPIVIVQLPGGDLEHFAAVLPANTVPPETAGGQKVDLIPRRFGLSVTVSASELRVAGVLDELLASLQERGAAVLVAVGPAPARELASLLEGAERVPWRPLVRATCQRVDGGESSVSGSTDRIELAFGLPDPSDLRLLHARALGRWLEVALRSQIPELRVDFDFASGCPRLVLRAPAEQTSPRALLRRLRDEVQGVVGRGPTAEEIAKVQTARASEAGRLAVEAARLAREVAEWVALGGSVTALLSTSQIDPRALAAFAQEVLGGHTGWATLVEQERRLRAPERETLENSALVSVAWVSGEIAVIAVALGGVAPTVGAVVLDRCAGVAAAEGWATYRADLLGVPTVALAVPGERTSEALELLVATVQGEEVGVTDALWKEVIEALGLRQRIVGENVSLAAALPLEAEEGAEAARKFLGALPAGGVQVGVPALARRLQWVPTEEPARLMAVLEVEGSVAGAVAATLVERRALEERLEAQLVALAGRFALVLTAKGEVDVPGLDGKLGAMWARLVRQADERELEQARAHLQARLLGDLACVVARRAAAAFLPAAVEERALREVSLQDANRVLSSVPAWTQVERFARGPAPRPGKGVGESRRTPAGG